MEIEERKIRMKKEIPLIIAEKEEKMRELESNNNLAREDWNEYNRRREDIINQCNLKMV